MMSPTERPQWQGVVSVVSVVTWSATLQQGERKGEKRILLYIYNNYYIYIITSLHPSFLVHANEFKLIDHMTTPTTPPGGQAPRPR